MTTHLVSTKQLTPDGIRGFAKSLGAFVAAAAALVADAWADGSITTAEWKTIAIGSVVAAVTAFLLPNAVKPVTTTTPVKPA